MEENLQQFFFKKINSLFINDIKKVYINNNNLLLIKYTLSGLIFVFSPIELKNQFIREN